MKGRMLIDFETDDFIAQMDLTGEIAGLAARNEIDKAKVTRLHVYKIEEAQGADSCADMGN